MENRVELVRGNFGGKNLKQHKAIILFIKIASQTYKARVLFHSKTRAKYMTIS